MVADESLDLSVIIPVYDEEKNVPLLHAQLKEVLEELGKSYEIVFVDDGSRDNTFDELSRLHEQDRRVKVVSFPSNFGKSAAYTAGFDFASGDTMITMDGDLQDDPADIPALLKKLDEGYDLVVGWKSQGRGPLGKSFPSWVFNRLSAWVTGLKIHDMNCPFKAYRKHLAKSLADEIYGELYRYQPLIARSGGYAVAEVKVQNYPRQHGRSKYGMAKFLKGFLDFLTILFLTRFTMSPLYLFGTIGLISTCIGGTIIVLLYLQKFLLGINVGNFFPLFTLSVLMVIFGVQFFSIGLLSEMIVHKDRTSAHKYTIKTILK
jgi:glycosyltransferase involved in cell wall biosynthesis